MQEAEGAQRERTQVGLSTLYRGCFTLCLFVCSDPKLASYTLLLANASLMKFEVSLSCLSGP